jgi:hypothetical protein
VTCGLTPQTGAHLIGWLADALRTHDIVRADLPVHAGPGGQAAHLQELRKVLLDALDRPDLLGEFTGARDAEDLGRLRPSLPHLTHVPADPGLCVR